MASGGRRAWRQRFARYGPRDRYEGPPGAGLCLSVFAVVRMRRSRKVLLGVPKRARRWREDWLHSTARGGGDEVFEEWRAPSCYLREGEHPDLALRRMMRGQLGVTRFRVKSPPRIVSYYAPSEWYPGRRHWDLAFVYEVEVGSPPRGAVASRWWKELGFFGKGKEVGTKEFGWNSDLMHDLGLT